MHDQKIYNDFFACVKELIAVIQPFYASIDDVSNIVQLMDKAREPHFVPDRILEVYWGNYFGKEHCDKYGVEKLLNLPVAEVEQIGDGVFFTLSDSVHEFAGKETIARRKKIKRALGLKKKFFQWCKTLFKSTHWWW